MLSCSKDEDKEGELDLVFKLIYDGHIMPILDENIYAYPSDEQYEFYISRMSFLLSEIALSGSSSFEDDDIRMIHFDTEYATDTKAREGIRLRLSGIPEGNYSQLSFGVGIPAVENAKEPSEFTSSQVLSSTGEYWPGWSSYIFSRVEGRLDSDRDGTFDREFNLHTGSDEVFLTLTAPNLNVNIEENNVSEIEIQINLDRYFAGDSQPYDILSNPNIHRLDQIDQVRELTTNLGRSFTIRSASVEN